MRDIAIVGAGIGGCLTAHALKARGYDVTLYSDKTPEDFLTRVRPTGAASRFEMALSWERELGLDHWHDTAPKGEGMHLTVCSDKGSQLLTLLGRFQRPFLGIDVRLQSARWLDDLVERGGRIEIEQVTLERLEDLAAHNDLTIVAAGRRELQALFPRDESRSTYRKPQRHLALVCVTGVPMDLAYCPVMRPVNFNLFPRDGEIFAVPWLSKGLQPGWALTLEAKPGGPLDRFGDVKSGPQALARMLEIVREYTPWDYEWLAAAELCDEHAWLTGAIVPEVRRPAGTLPSGRHVLALGDTAHSLDPIGGQGANNVTKMSRHLVECIVDRGESAFDREWMLGVDDRYWGRHKWIHILNNLLLEPLTPAGQLLLAAQYGSTGHVANGDPRQRLADVLVDNFNDPIQRTDAFIDEARARELIREMFGSVGRPLLGGRLRILRGQVRQRLGLPAGHPGT